MEDTFFMNKRGTKWVKQLEHSLSDDTSLWPQKELLTEERFHIIGFYLFGMGVFQLRKEDINREEIVPIKHQEFYKLKNIF